MISKFRKMQDTWFAKTILVLTGLSFVSLFGVAGYMGSVGKNKPVIKVDHFEMLQGDVLGQLDKEVQMARRLFGDGFEISDTIRSNMLQDVVQKNLNKLILRNIAQKNNISISNDLVRQVIFSQSEFYGANGRFDVNRFRQILSASQMTEQQYIDSIKNEVVSQNIIQTPVKNVNIPLVLQKYASLINNQKRVFKYITLDIKHLPIDRKISEDEIQQYYQDFNLNFMAPEARDISFIYLSNDQISKQIVVSDEDAEAFYKDNSSRFETPETRQLLQMVFSGESEAKAALSDLNTGKDFYSVAKDRAHQEKADTTLGFVAQDMLLEALSEPVFSAAKGAVVGPLRTDMGWHIIKVSDIKSGSKIDKSTALREIKETLKKERMYDEAYELISKLEDRVGSGEDLTAIARSFNVPVQTAKNLEETGHASLSDKAFERIISEADFIDAAFSYNAGEISQVVELDDGIALLKIDEIYDAHPKDLKDVRPQIISMWEDNERTAIAQEITNDVLHDLENGDRIDEITSRFKLNLKTTQALSRQQSFADLSEMDMKELFLETLNAPRVFHVKDKEIIAIASEIINPSSAQATDEKALRETKLDLTQEYANRLLSDFSSDYDIRVKYRLLGLDE